MHGFLHAPNLDHLPGARRHRSSSAAGARARFRIQYQCSEAAQRGHARRRGALPDGVVVPLFATGARRQPPPTAHIQSREARWPAQSAGRRVAWEVSGRALATRAAAVELAPAVRCRCPWRKDTAALRWHGAAARGPCSPQLQSAEV
jgi:hypothetical protein